MSTYGPEFFRNYIDMLDEAGLPSGTPHLDDLDDADGDGVLDIEKKMEKTRQTAIAAGFVKPDGSADTRAYFKSIADKQDAESAAANAKYWKENPGGKYEKIGNVTSMVMPPRPTDPEAQKANQARIDKARKDRTQAYKDKVKASGGKFMGDELGPGQGSSSLGDVFSPGSWD